jgi:hypothetical protein
MNSADRNSLYKILRRQLKDAPGSEILRLSRKLHRGKAIIPKPPALSGPAPVEALP